MHYKVALMLVLLKGHEPRISCINIILLVQVSCWLLMINHFICPTQGERGNYHIQVCLSFIQHESPEIICNMESTILS